MDIEEDNKRTYVCPYGARLFAVPATCTILDLIFYHFAAFGCHTFWLANATVQYNGYWGGKTSVASVGFGYWSMSTYNGYCVKFHASNLDGIWKVGRFTGVFGSLLTWVVFAFVMSTACFQYAQSEFVFKLISVCMCLLSLFSLLLLVGVIEPVDSGNLTIGGGGVLAILSAILWFGGAVSMSFLKERERHENETSHYHLQAHDRHRCDVVRHVATNIDTVVNADGMTTKTTTKTTSLEDGSKRVEETVETYREYEVL